MYNQCDYDIDSYEFKWFVANAEQPLFEGDESTKLESVLEMHNWKARFGISDNDFTDVLYSVCYLLLKDHMLPISAYEAKKTLSDLGLKYTKFDACPNDFVLYTSLEG